MDIPGLNIFAAVAETGNMTRAARRLGLTQSAVSQAIVRLEEQLGARLIDRRRRPLRLTVAGDTLLAGCAQVMEAAKSLTDEVRAAGENRPSMVRVGLVDSFAATAGPALIRTLRRHVDQISVWSGITPNLLAELMENRLDMMVASGANPTLGANLGATWRPVLTEPFMMVVPASVAARTPTPRLRDMARNHPMIRYSIRSHIGVQVEEILREQGVDAPKSMEFDSTDSVMPMVAAGLGWGISTPLCMVHGRPFAKNVALAPIADPAPTRTLFLVHRGYADEGIVGVAEQEIRTILTKLITGPVRALAPWAEAQMIAHA